jgi:hypothetical protein
MANSPFRAPVGDTVAISIKFKTRIESWLETRPDTPDSVWGVGLLLMDYGPTVTTVAMAQPTGREQQIVEILQTLAKLRDARKRDAVGDIIASEKHLNDLIERLRPSAN